MHSFTLTAIGNLTKDPERLEKKGVAYTKLCLIASDYAGRNEEGGPQEVVISEWFVAFGSLGESIARYVRKGDQLILEAHLRQSQWTDTEGRTRYGSSYIVDGFKFGAKGRLSRQQPDAESGEAS